MRRRMTRSTGAVSGLLIILLGVWGALIPFVGPYFDYSFSTNTTWHYTTDRLWLDILPGALAVLAGVLLLLAATRAAGILAGWLAMVAGAWFVVGPSVSLTWESGVGPIGRPLYGSTRQMLELVGYFYGLGALIVALAAFSIGRFVSRPALAEEAATVGPGDRAPVAPPPAPSRTAGAEEGRRCRFPLPRRGQRARSDREGTGREGSGRSGSTIGR
jgi:peptidoglycan/LPS O-acetylase OafA/YrhL